MNVEKLPLKSKKFIAFFFSLLLLAAILIIALFTQPFNWPMIAFMSIGIFGICALAIGYILPQAALDKFVRGVTSIANRGNQENINEEEN